MNGAVGLIDIERFVLRDPAFTAERAERIRQSLRRELERRMLHVSESADIPTGSLESLQLDIRSSDDDETIARRVADSILDSTGFGAGGAA